MSQGSQGLPLQSILSYLEVDIAVAALVLGQVRAALATQGPGKEAQGEGSEVASSYLPQDWTPALPSLLSGPQVGRAPETWGMGEGYAAASSLFPHPTIHSTPRDRGRDRDGLGTKVGTGLYQGQKTEKGQCRNNSTASHLLRPSLCQA